MDCENCGNGVIENWEYCPFCGSSLKGSIAPRFPAFVGFEDLLTDIDEEFRRMEDTFRNVWLDRKHFGDVKGGGISIRISSKEGEKPKIDVQTFSDYREHEPNRGELPKSEKARTPPKVTREPKTVVEQKGDKSILRVEIPGVTDENDIDIRRMAESIEIRAYAKDGAYFTLFCIPADSKILSKRLEKGELIIEVGG